MGKRKPAAKRSAPAASAKTEQPKAEETKSETPAETPKPQEPITSKQEGSIGESPVVVPADGSTETLPNPADGTGELPTIGDAPKSSIEKSVEESKNHVAKGYEPVEVTGEGDEPKVSAPIVKEVEIPEDGEYAKADIKGNYANPNANIEHQELNYTEVQKSADIK